MKKENYSLNDLQKRYVVPDIAEKGDSICLFHSLKEMPSDFTLLTFPYVFSSKVRKSINLDSALGSSLLIIDEAHNIEDVCSLFEQRISIDRIRRMESAFSKITQQGILWVETKEASEVRTALSEVSRVVLEFGDL